MSTDYEIARSKKKDKVFSVGEGSNKFDLAVEADGCSDGCYPVFDGLTTEQLIAVATRMLRVASYWGADESVIKNAGVVALDYSVKLPVVEVE